MHFKPLCLKFVQHLKEQTAVDVECASWSLPLSSPHMREQRASTLQNTEPKQAGMQSGQQKKYEREKKITVLRQIKT